MEGMEGGLVARLGADWNGWLSCHPDPVEGFFWLISDETSTLTVHRFPGTVSLYHDRTSYTR